MGANCGDTKGGDKEHTNVIVELPHYHPGGPATSMYRGIEK